MDLRNTSSKWNCFPNYRLAKPMSSTIPRPSIATPGTAPPQRRNHTTVGFHTFHCFFFNLFIYIFNFIPNWVSYFTMTLHCFDPTLTLQNLKPIKTQQSNPSKSPNLVLDHSNFDQNLHSESKTQKTHEANP
jgi:hypothetical protein